MVPVALIGIDRPSIIAALAVHGMRAAEVGDHAAATLSRDHPDGRPRSIVEVEDTASLVAALNGGADDAVLTSDSDAVVAARLGALVRRRPSTTIALGDLSIDTLERRVTRAGKRIPLLPREYALLLHLAREPGVTHDRAGLLAAVWGLDFDPGTNVIEVHMSRLRAKLDRGATPILLTDKGRGYRLVPVGPWQLTASG